MRVASNFLHHFLPQVALVGGADCDPDEGGGVWLLSILSRSLELDPPDALLVRAGWYDRLE
jgi:hypothetical protein